MNNEIQRFDFKGESLRALTNMSGEPWFVLKDCMSILDLGNPTETVKMFDDDEFSTTEVIDSIGRRQQAYIISEPGMYRLVMRSRKPEAKEFQRWVTHEVLPYHSQAWRIHDPADVGQSAHQPGLPDPARHQAEGGAGEGQVTGAESQGVG